MRSTMALGLALGGLIAACDVRAADPVPVPDLIGTWKGGGLGVGKQEGFVDTAVTLVIEEQRERAFNGKKTHTEGEEGFFGAILADGRTLLITDDGDGQSIGSILSSDSIEVCYAESGDDAQVFCRVLTRAE